MQVKTSDLYFAAFLQCLGCKIVKTDKQASKFTFIFEDSENMENMKESYFNEGVESSIPALKYANTIRSLKTLLYVHN
jgi:hypothetical protein